MKNVRSTVGLRWSGRRIAIVLAAAMLLGACGSDGGDSASAPTTSAPKPAGAKENAIASASGSIPILVSPSTGLSGQTLNVVCFDLYVAGKTTPCAENTIGPGGGVIFYDAKTVQPWGRFLEVARWSWNPSVAADFTWDCKGGCGADPNSVLNPIPDRTQDDIQSGGALGYKLCDLRGTYQELSGAAADTGEAIGTGRANTAALLADPACSINTPTNNTADHPAVLALVANYRGGKLDDWFLPSKDELVALCRFGNRNGVGGFNANGRYASSSTENSNWKVWHVGFDNCAAGKDRAATSERGSKDYSVRPIRAF